MSQQFSIVEAWLVHEGGTKFYHPIRLMRMSSAVTSVVTAVHFAGFKGDHTSFRRPVRGGQVQIKAVDIFQRQVESKLRSGYRPHLEQWGMSTADENEFRNKVVEMFGRTDAELIFMGLRMNISPGVETDEPIKEYERPKDPGEDSDVDKFKDRPAAWGSW